MASKKTAVVICPGRGSYTKEELGYIKNHKQKYPFIQEQKQYREKQQQKCIYELDSASQFSIKDHLPGENASGLIYISSYLDFKSIDLQKYEILAVTGNSMGWYTTLSLAGAVKGFSGFELVNTMGSMMKTGNVGYQIIYPIVDENWHKDPHKLNLVEQTLIKVNQTEGAKAYVSIKFGGYLILGVNDLGGKLLLNELPKIDEIYPLKMASHAAFHTPLLEEVTSRALNHFDTDFFCEPSLAMIDGRGKIWNPYSTNPIALRQYTFDHQVSKTYDFSLAIQVALKEFAPDVLILLGPGSSSGGAIAQIMIEMGWAGLKNRADFSGRQKTDPILLSMGRPEQKALVGE